MAEPRKLTCFVIMPYGDKVDARGIVHHLDNVYDHLIKPAVESCEDATRRITINRADKMPGAGSIHREMFEQLLNADIAVVDLSLANPNVFYELGVRHALRDRVTVLIREKSSSIPFNVNNQKIIEYEVGFGEPDRLIAAIADDIKAGLDGRTDSPVLDLLGLAPQAKPHRLPPGRKYRAAVGPEGRFVEIVTGGLADQDADANVWVNSENTYFAMARTFSSSISGTIRWLGGVDGEDVVFDALEKEIGERRPRGPLEVVITTSGGLSERGVERICHVAAVHAVPGREYQPVDGIERAVTVVVAAIEDEIATGRWTPADPVAVLFPILGSGKAKGDLTKTIGLLVDEACKVLRSARTKHVERIQFLAYTDRDLDACLQAGQLHGLDLQEAEPAAQSCGGERDDEHSPDRAVT